VQAAYVVGALLVLLHEKPELVVTDSISILVESAVPEGKGVSSSAAIEVATMAALAAAYDVMLEPTELAILCQKVRASFPASWSVALQCHWLV
jgi:L-arabinokinase